MSSTQTFHPTSRFTDIECELMETVLQLRAENSKLQKIINSAKASLSLAAYEGRVIMYTNDYHTSIGGGNAQGINTKTGQLGNGDSDSLEACEKVPRDALMGERSRVSNHVGHDAEISRQIPETYLPALPCHSRRSIQFTDSWMDQSAIEVTLKWYSNLDPVTFLSPLATAMPSPPQRSVSKRCPLWERSNNIYGQVLNVDSSAASQALALNSSHYADMIFRAVIKGWSGLNSDERLNPIMQALADMDQVFSELDPASRVAFMYKSHMILKYHMDPEKRTLDEMPEWQKPLPSQLSKQHDIAVDFFVWPSWRDRFVTSDHDYFATSDFSDYFRRFYKFNWPFAFEDTYIHDIHTNTYRVSPIFQLYHENISYWGVQMPFLKKFPELAHDIIPRHDNTPSATMDRIQTSGKVPEFSHLVGKADISMSDMFAQGDLLEELFNGYPNVS